MELLEWLLVAVVVAIFAAFAAHRWEQFDECEAKGGTAHCPYKSSCVCLKPGTVIE